LYLKSKLAIIGQLKDSMITEKFDMQKCAKYRESVIELLGRACTVSVETIP